MNKSQQPEEASNKMISTDRKPTIDIVVLQRPTYATFECPKCLTDIEIPYSEFCAEHGEPCDWSGGETQCPECGKVYEIDGWEFT